MKKTQKVKGINVRGASFEQRSGEEQVWNGSLYNRRLITKWTQVSVAGITAGRQEGVSQVTGKQGDQTTGLKQNNKHKSKIFVRMMVNKYKAHFSQENCIHLFKELFLNVHSWPKCCKITIKSRVVEMISTTNDKILGYVSICTNIKQDD